MLSVFYYVFLLYVFMWHMLQMASERGRCRVYVGKQAPLLDPKLLAFLDTSLLKIFSSLQWTPAKCAWLCAHTRQAHTESSLPTFGKDSPFQLQTSLPEGEGGDAGLKEGLLQQHGTGPNQRPSFFYIPQTHRDVYLQKTAIFSSRYQGVKKILVSLVFYFASRGLVLGVFFVVVLILFKTVISYRKYFQRAAGAACWANDANIAVQLLLIIY